MPALYQPHPAVAFPVAGGAEREIDGIPKAVLENQLHQSHEATTSGTRQGPR